MSKKENYVIVGSELLKKSRKTTREPNIKNGCNLYSNITFKNGCVYANINTVKSNNNVFKILKEITYKEFNNFLKNSKLFEDYYIFSISNEDNIVK